MAPKKLKKFHTVKVECVKGHDIASYRKPDSETGRRTHKLWLVHERIGKLSTEPPILVHESNTNKLSLNIPPDGTSIMCGHPDCSLQVGKIGMVQGTVALVLDERNLKPTKG